VAEGKANRGRGRRDLQGRLTALAGLVVIVGGVVAVLFFAGVLGSQGGGEGIENVRLLEPPRGPGQEDLDVAPREGSLAPDFEISDFDGARHRLSDYRGNPVYVNFWATWCGPCREELPEIQELLDRHEDDLAIITVNRSEPLDRAKAFFADIDRLNGEPGVSFTVDGMDPDDRLYNEYRGLGMPVSVFVDANGKVVKVFNGRISLEIMEEAVTQAIASARVPDGGTTGSGGS